MAEQFYTILTEIGKAKIANSIPLGTKVNFTKLKVGDSNGSYYNPTESQTDLVNTKWESNISSVSTDKLNPNWIVIEVIIPGKDGGFVIREAGIFDDEGDMIAVGKYPETYKPIIEDGSTKELLIRIILEVTNTESIVMKIDPTIILATKKEIQILESKMNDLVNKFNLHLGDNKSHIPYGVATGSTNTYAVTISPTPKEYVDGMALCAKINVDSTGASTINVNKLGARNIKKANGNNVTNLKANGVYTLRYNSSTENFILQGEGASGNATASDLLSGKTADTDAGEITGSIPSKTAQTYTPGTTNQTISAGQYISEIQTILGDPSLTENNIISSAKIFGIQGKASVVDTQDANALAGEIFSGKIAYVNGVKIVGTYIASSPPPVSDPGFSAGSAQLNAVAESEADYTFNITSSNGCVIKSISVSYSGVDRAGLSVDVNRSVSIGSWSDGWVSGRAEPGFRIGFRPNADGRSGNLYVQAFYANVTAHVYYTTGNA